MNDLFKKDITIKIASVLIAVTFWLYVSNIANPYSVKTFYNIPLKMENESFLDDNGYTIKSMDRTSIDITIRGRQEAIDKIRSSDFETLLDLSQIQSVDDKKLMITEPVCTQKDVTIVSYSPTIINVQLARNKSGSFPVELKSNITMKPGFVLVNTVLSPESITIGGEESIIDSVGSIKANLELKNLDRDTTTTVECKVYNKEGKEISSLSNGLKVNVTLEVAKEVPISLVTRGRLAADYVETLRVIEPVKALITGAAETLGSISELKTEPVDIDNITGNFTKAVSIVVPEGVKLVNGQKEITVSINVEKLMLRDIELVNNDISILNAVNDGSLTYEIKTDKLVLQFKGKQADLNTISPESLKPAVDVAGLAEGTYKLPLNVTMPSQVKLTQQAQVEVVISKTAETPATTVP